MSSVTATTAPYSVSWENVNAGDYFITAKAYDNSGSYAVSDFVPVSVNDGSGIGEVIWQEDFNTIDKDIWNFEIGNGAWGWGNGELEYYTEENASIQAVPDEAGNSALVIEARNETAGDFQFTSSRLKSEDRLSIKYGVIDVRLKVPDLEDGLWPAFWMLGTSANTWPHTGEIDIMEMGHNSEERARQLAPDAHVNNYTMANMIWYDESSCNDTLNPTCAASSAWDINYASPYVAATSLADRFVNYRMYWSPSSIRLTIIDEGTEYDLYESPYGIQGGVPSEVFRTPFYFLMNLAVGGGFTNASTNEEMSAALPAQMWIDKIEVRVFPTPTSYPSKPTPLLTRKPAPSF